MQGTFNIESALTDHLGLIRSVVNEHLPRRHRQHFDDVLQSTIVHLWQYTIPAFDPARGSLCTLVYVATKQRVFHEVGKLERGPQRTDLNSDCDSEVAPAEFDADRIADAILSSPRRFLTKRQVELLALIRAGAKTAEISRKMNLKDTGVWALFQKLKTRIGQLATPEDLQRS